MHPGSLPHAEAEQHLLDAARRASRQPVPMIVLALHLGSLTPPAPRPHHRRVARAMLQEAAQRYGGRVLQLAGGDLVLLAPVDPTDGRRSGPAGRIAALPGVLGQLLRADTPDAERLVTLWRLPDMAASFLDYAATRAAEPPPLAALGATEPFSLSQTNAADELAAAAETAAPADVLRRQTGVLLPPPGSGLTLQPLFREIWFSLPALEARAAASRRGEIDPFLLGHLAGRLDQRLLSLLTDRHLPSEVTGLAPDAPALHLNLTLSGVLSLGFDRLAALCAASATHAGIEISLIEACADPAGFASARARIASAGFTLILDHVSHLALTMAQLAPLGADLIKLSWSSHLAALPAPETQRLDTAVARIDPNRLVLCRADSEAALRWGLARGIRRFQGRHVDAMVAASRLSVCEWASACSLRQCSERANAVGQAARLSCGNLTLLDQGAPGASDGRSRREPGAEAA